MISLLVLGLPDRRLRPGTTYPDAYSPRGAREGKNRESTGGTGAQKWRSVEVYYPCLDVELLCHREHPDQLDDYLVRDLSVSGPGC